MLVAEWTAGRRVNITDDHFNVRLRIYRHSREGGECT